MGNNCKKLREALFASLLIGVIVSCVADAQSPKGIDPSILTKAKAGDATAQVAVAKAYVSGRGVPQDFKKASQWYLNAAEQGNAEAESMIGTAYFLGSGVPLDCTKAVEWWRKAGEQGNTGALSLLAMAYEKGEEGKGLCVTQNFTQAAFWYRKAADLGDYYAEYKLALLYDIGSGVPQNQTQAVALYRDAAEKGVAGAQYMLGMKYASGRFITQNLTEAYFWLDLAASGKLEDIKQEDIAKERDAVAIHLSSAVLMDTQERARKWAEDHPPKTSPE
jgi:TPR repeat protein